MADLAEAGTAPAARDRSAEPARRYKAIEVAGLHKTFRIPKHQIQTFKERLLHPLRRTEYNELHVLKGVSFEILEGEFFGIVGRNGSGKSTLLKCLASIYRADTGSIRIAGRLAPFIELGVGFNPNLPARENVILNGVMMGLTQREAKDRFDAVIAFAELEDFLDLELKNYSSGMQVRLAFSVMVQSDADVLLIDEVLAVGDAAFQQKCFDVFDDIHRAGKTVVLVTHDMGLVERFCDRGMLIADAHIRHVGPPHEIAREYLRENFRTYQSEGPDYVTPDEVRLVDAWTDCEGERLDSSYFGDSLGLHVTIEAREHIEAPAVALWLSNTDGQRIYSVGARENGEALADLEPGEQLTFSVQLVNNLTAGHYYLGCSVTRGSAGLDVLLLQQRAADLVSYGAQLSGVVAVDHTSQLTRKRQEQP